jgi:hypothetical protein
MGLRLKFRRGAFCLLLLLVLLVLVLVLVLVLPSAPSVL